MQAVFQGRLEAAERFVEEFAFFVRTAVGFERAVSFPKRRAQVEAMEDPFEIRVAPDTAVPIQNRRYAILSLAARDEDVSEPQIAVNQSGCLDLVEYARHLVENRHHANMVRYRHKRMALQLLLQRQRVPADELAPLPKRLERGRGAEPAGRVLNRMDLPRVAAEFAKDRVLLGRGQHFQAVEGVIPRAMLRDDVVAVDDPF